MAITITLQPDVEARLIMKAQVAGISIEELLEKTVDSLMSSSERHEDVQLSSDEKAQQFLRWAERYVNQVPLLDDEAIS